MFSVSCGTDAVESEENIVERFTINTSTIEEGDTNETKEIRLLLDGTLSSEITVNYQITEITAAFDLDIMPGSGSLTFRPNQLEAVMPVEIVGDDHFEISEKFAIEITYNGTVTSFTTTIFDNDEPGNIQSDQDGFFTPETYPSMRSVWTDEFEENTLNLDNWSYEIGNGCNQGICGWGNQELQDYTSQEENITIRDGKLVITARNDNGNYTSARIKTEDKVELQYGRIDIRARLPEGQGIWPATWMLGANISEVGWPSCGEIDIMELVGNEPSVVHGTVHYENNGYKTNTGSRSLPQGKYSDLFHVFTIVWDQDIVTWYVDNQPFKTFRRSGINNYPFNAPFFFIFNVAIGGLWPGNPDQTTEFPQEMVIDYIRVFQ